MRKFILTALIIQSFCSAQPALPVNESGRVEYAGVETVDSATAAQLYSRAKLFIINSFVSGKDVTQLTDDAAMVVVGKGLIPVTVRALGMNYDYGDFTIKITIECKNGRYRYKFSEFTHKNVNSKGDYSGGSIENEKPACGGLRMSKKQWEAIKEQVNVHSIELIQKLRSEMQTAGKDDW